MTNEFDDDPELEKPAGLPGWMATFADMMALLMCFFVLLLSYSQIDAQKFKRIAGSMKQAFGVQNEIAVEDIPKGTSPIFAEFSPARPEPTPIPNIEQNTVDSSQEKLLQDEQQKLEALEQQALDALLAKRQLEQQAKQAQASRDLLRHLQVQLQTELQEGVLELEQSGQQIIFRIRENGSFGSASAFLQPRFKPVILKITRLLNDIPGVVTVAGHTDDQPVAKDMFDNNWDLSAQRAVAVATQMTRIADFDTSRLSISGHASNLPIDSSNTLVGRQTNRRVEIIVTQGKAKDAGTLELLPSR